MTSLFYDNPECSAGRDPRRPDRDIRYFLPPPQELEASADAHLLRATALTMYHEQEPYHTIQSEFVHAICFTYHTFAASVLDCLRRSSEAYQAELQAYSEEHL
jgi:hypothetical protein